MPLTVVTLKNARSSDKPYKLADGRGLYILVQPSGGRLWRYDYRFAGKRKTLALGSFPDVGLADARAAVDGARAQLRGKIDPGVARKEVREAPVRAPNRKFAQVAQRWFDTKKAAWVEGYASRVWGRVTEDLVAHFGEIDVAEVKADDVLRELRIVEARGAVESARRIRNYCEEIYRFARSEGLTDTDPCADLLAALKALPPKKHRAALKPVELPAFLAKLEAFDGELRTTLALKLALLTFVRTSELRFARWREFEDLDGAEPLWRIPAARMKMRSEHLVPLAPRAVTVVKQLWALSPKSDLLLQSQTKSGVISENTLIYALYRMGYHSRATVHGFRATASTALNEGGFNRDWIERQLAHVETNQIRAVYNAAEWLPGRREMMCWWADFLDRAGLTIGP